MGVLMIDGFIAEGIIAVGFLLLMLLKSFVQWPGLVRWFSLAIMSFALASLLSHGGGTDTGVLFTTDALAYLSKIFVVAFGGVIFIFLDDYVSQYALPEMEVYFLLGMQILGMLICVSCVHWISLFLGLELMYLPTYALVAIRSTNKESQEAACKYIILGAFSTGLLLYGIGLLYGAVGSFSFQDHLSFVQSALQSSWLMLDSAKLLFSTGWVFITISFLFKMGVVPFHFWVRDVYEGSLYVVTALISSVPKLVLVVIWLRLFSGDVVAQIGFWQMGVFSVGLLSIFFGNFLALVQERVRSLLAYASFSNMGLVLLALGMTSTEGNYAALVYVLGYLFTVMLLLLLLGCVRVKGRDLILLDDLKGMAYTYPQVAFLAALALFSLLGVPPLVGFMFKVNLVLSLLNAQYTVFAVLVVLATVLSAYYYIQMIGLMCFYPPDDNAMVQLHISVGQRLFFYASAGILLAFGLFPQSIFALIYHIV